MPLPPLTERSVSRLDDRALHRQLADLLRAAIVAGDLAPGESLPSEGALGRVTGLSRTTVREALDLLDVEGRITRRAGRPAVIAFPPTVRHMATERYRRELDLLRSLRDDPHPQTSAFTDDHHLAWVDYGVRATYAEGLAHPDEVDLLRVPIGTAVLRRRLLKTARGVPVQVQDSVLPLDLVRDTPIAQAHRQPWPGGTIAELWSIGLLVTAVEETAAARIPREEECRALEMITAAPVLEVVRVFTGRRRDIDAYPPDALHPTRPLEASRVVVPATGVLLQWSTVLD